MRGERDLRSGIGNLSDDAAGALGRAAGFRIEADILRQRADATDEAVIREQYRALAERWSMLAAHLEASVLDHAVD